MVSFIGTIFVPLIVDMDQIIKFGNETFSSLGEHESHCCLYSRKSLPP